MKTFSIIADDKAVVLGGVSYSGLTFPLDSNIHAVQWYGEYGEIEYKPKFNADTKTITKAPNEIITKFTRFNPAIDAWYQADAAAKQGGV